MKTLLLILGDQLFEDHAGVDLADTILMIESPEICSRHRYHKQKIAYIWTCMREYRDVLLKKYPEKQIIYIDITQQKSFESVFSELSSDYTKSIYLEITDKAFSLRIDALCKKYFTGVEVVSDSDMFLTTRDDFSDYLQNKTAKRLLMQDFYIWQRRRLGILVNSAGQPIGEKWSFDEENRKKLPKNIAIPERVSAPQSPHFTEVQTAVQTYFPNNPGELTQLYFPINHTDAQNWLQNFFENYLELFGDYEDALTDRADLVFHSALTPMLNNGLLTPRYVLDQLAVFCKNQWNFDIFSSDDLIGSAPINSIEGFIRQIIGWREWIKGMYDTKYSENIDEYNYFKHTKPLPNYFYDYDEMIKLESTNYPLAKALQKVWKTGYNHHIERLMVIANWMVLSQYDPKACFNWFMEMYVDAYDWVMVPNVLGMGLFADGGIFATKPYISGGNYIKKMSDYQDSKTWESLWTDLFWQFLLRHETFFNSNPRMSMLISGHKKRNPTKI